MHILGIYDNSGASSDYNLAIAVVEDNIISDNTGYGVWLDDDYSPQPSPHIGNFVYADLGGGQGLIAGEPGSNGGNLIIGNGDGINPADIVNNIPADVIPIVLALDNTFDHQSYPDIDGLDIYDDDEDPLYGQVLFGGPLQ